MAIDVVVKETETPQPIPEGLYAAIVKEIVEGDGNFGPFLKVIFEINVGDYTGTTRSLVASKKLSKGKDGKTSKLFGLVKTLTGKEPETGATLDLETLIGKPCQIFVENGKEKDGVTFQNVSKVIPV